MEKNGLYTGCNSAEKNVYSVVYKKNGFQPQNAEWVSEQQCPLK